MRRLNVGVIGSGDVGKVLAAGFAGLGHDVMIGSREPAKLQDFAKKTNRVTAGTFEETARFGELIVLATLGIGTEEALRIAGPKKFDGKVVMDATNPLDFSGGMPPKLFRWTYRLSR